MQLHPHDTVAVVLENALGCTDSSLTYLTGMPSPHLTARITSSSTNALGSATFAYALQTDQSNTVVEWIAYGTGIRDISPDSGTVAAFGPNAVQTIEIRATVMSAFDLGLLRLTLSPHGGGCAGMVLVVTDTITPDTQAVFVPEAFTPDGNGQNDTWMITCMDGIDPMDYNMEVYNESGGKVLEMDGLRQDWDGGSLPDGVYWWVLLNQDGSAAQAGGVTIRRK
jgi:gliding motility-associated-like protein